MRERASLSIGCTVLAAGAGTRFGPPGDKLVAMVRGRPLAQHSIDAAVGSSSSRCSLIVGAAADRVLSIVDARRCAVYRNDEWASGIASSIHVAVAAHAQDDALVILLADAPMVGSSDVDSLIAAWMKRPVRPAALRSRNIWGSPAIFPRSSFDALWRLQGDRGAKSALLARGRVTLVDAASPGLFSDVDRRSDLSRLDGS